MASIVIAGDTSGSVTLQAPAVAGSTVLNLPSTSGTIQTSGAGYTTNGVAYATSTSALATGSALTFDGSNLTLQATNTAVVFNNSSGTPAFQVGYIGGTNRLQGRGVVDAPMTFYVSDYEQMRLTSTGLGIGTSSPATKLNVSSSTTNTARIRVTGTGSTAGNYRGYEFASSGGFSGGIFQDESTSALSFWSSSSGSSMTLDSAGNLGLGVTPSAWSSGARVLEIGTVGNAIYGNNASNSETGMVSGAYYNSGWKYSRTGIAPTRFSMNDVAYGQMEWYTAPSGTAGNAITFTQAMTLDASGNLLVGTTSLISGTTGVNFVSSNANGILAVNNTNASFTSTLYYGLTTRAASTAFDLMGLYANTVGQFRVSGTGVIYAQNTSVQSISDQRLKENIRDATDGLNVITALRTVRFDWKEGFGNDRKDQLGFIAQEVETVFPEAVSEWKVNKEDETIYKTVGPSALIPVLVKAIQEQQALINTLTDRISVLENK